MARKTASVTEQNKTEISESVSEKEQSSSVENSEPEQVEQTKSANTKTTARKTSTKKVAEEVTEPEPEPEDDVEEDTESETENLQESVDEENGETETEENIDDSTGEIITTEKDDKIPLIVTDPKKQLKKVKKLRKKKKLNQNPERFESSAETGLSNEQINQRIEEGQVNITTKTNSKSYLQIILSNTFTFFNTLCFIIAALLLVIYANNNTIKENLTNLFFIIIILCNLLIGIIQEIKAKRMVDKIKLMTSPSATVIRNGEQTEIPINELVLDDIIVLYSGKQVPADSIIVEGSLEANESMLTGESVPVKKDEGAELYGGSVIISGKAKVRINKVGDDCYDALLASKAKKYKKPDSQLLKTMNLITRVIGIVIIPLAILTLLDMVITLDAESSINIFTKAGLEYIWSELPNIMSRFAASIIGMIPAGMFLLTSMALAVGVIKLAKKKTLVHDLYSIEMLARVDVLCLDKTGTITDGSMKVHQILMVNNSYNLTIHDIIGSMLKELNDTNQTSVALADYFGYRNIYKKKAIIPFSSSRKYSAVSFTNGETYLLGAYDYTPGLEVSRNKEIMRTIDNDVKYYQEKGYRILMFSKSSKEIKELAEDKVKTFPEGTKIYPIAFIVIEEHIRENAKEIIENFQKNGVQVKVISGDNPFTVREISNAAGVENSDLCISLQGMSEQDVINAASTHNVFGRVTPEQKCILVKALKSQGHKVAMTGDGVNDILALKEADCSITIKSGSEAARNVSNLVMLSDDFSSMPAVVSEGRRVINNVQNSASLFLVKTLFVTLMTILFLILPNSSFPFQPRNFLLIELFMSGLPSFFLALQPNNDIIKGNFLANLLARVIPGGFVMFMNVLICYLANILLKNVPGLEIQPEYLNTMCCLVMIFTGVIILYVTCKPINVYRGILLLVDIALLVFTMFILPSIIMFNLGFTMFDITDITQLVYALVTFAIIIGTFSTYRVILDFVIKLKDKIVD